MQCLLLGDGDDLYMEAAAVAAPLCSRLPRVRRLSNLLVGSWPEGLLWPKLVL